MIKLINRIFIILLAYITTYIFYKNILVFRIDDYFNMTKLIVLKNIESPYSYRILFPYVFNFLGALTSIRLFLVSVLSVYFAINYFTIVLIKEIANIYLIDLRNKSILILLFLFSQVFLQTSYVIDDNFIFLIFLLILFYSERLYWFKLYLILIISVFCRPQSIYFLLFTLIIIYFNKNLNFQNILKIIILLVVATSSYFTITLIFKSDYIDIYTIMHHIENNSKYFVSKILPLWLVIGPLLFAIFIKFKNLNIKHRFFIFATIPYTLIFFIKGNLWELDKYFPAIFIFLISFINLYHFRKDIN